MSKVFAEMDEYSTAGGLIYEEIALKFSAGERARGINEYIRGLNEGLPHIHPTDNQFLYLLAGMECAAHHMGHEDEARYIGSKIDELTVF